MPSPRRSPALFALLIAASPTFLSPQPAFAQDAPPLSEAAASAPSEGKATLPRPLNYAPPRYPPEAEKEGLEATVTLQIDIDKKGHVTRAVVIEPAGHGFDESAVEAAQKLDFEPARKADGSPFAARILYRYSFTLKPAAPPPSAGSAGASAGTAQKPERNASLLSGSVFAAGEDAPLASAEITATDASGRAAVAVTDAAGHFHFDAILPGRHHITVRAAGFDTVELDENLTENEALEVKYRLIASGGALEVTVRGDRPPREVTKRTITQRELSRIPGTNGDALRALQNMPGVTRPPGLAGLLIVRGSSPQDTQTFIDGTPVPLIYHFFGLASVVPTELLDKIDFYPGNFSVQYGRVTGGIVDAGIRPVKSDGHYHGLAQLDLIDARLMLEGPVPLVSGWRFAAAGRRSHLDAWLGPVLENAVSGVTQAPVYYDYQFMLETDPTPSSRFRVAYYGSDDAIAILVAEPSVDEPALSGDIGLHTAFQRLALRYNNDDLLGGRLRATLSFGRDNIALGVGSIYFFIDTSSISGRIEASKRLSSGVTLNLGADVYAGAYTSSYRGPTPPIPGEPANQPFSTRTLREGTFRGHLFNPAAYLELELSPSARAKIVPGLRVDSYNVAEGVDVSPRVTARYDIFQAYPRTTAKAGLGVFHQPPQLQEAVVPIGTPGLSSSRAIHYSIGAEQEITRRLEISAEGFYKQMDRLVVGTPAPYGASLVYKNIGSGYAVGSEVLIKYKADDRFFGWAAYTLSRSIRVDGPGKPERPFESDQTHSLTVLGSLKIADGWEIGARFRLTSGDVATPEVCDPEASASCDPNRPNSLFHSPSGGYTPLPSNLGAYSERLPLFHQLDLRVDKTWHLSRFNIAAYLDLQNVYNHANIEGINYNFNYTTRRYSTGLPILPSLGIRADF